MEVESALVDHPKVAEAAVVGRAHESEGTGHLGVRHSQRRQRADALA
jgi:acyl-coenzyme A synthetase/AMP-(fatty) acid ligase